MLEYCNMAEAVETGEPQHASAQMGSFPRDLLQRFSTGNHLPRKFEGANHGEEEDIELSLGLSLNGRFGVDPKRAKMLIRSSSVSNFMTTDETTACFAPVASYTPLTRTCSLPTGTEEEWRKRKELQSLRRLEAKRKRLEKLKNVRVIRDKVDLEENCEENGQAFVPVNRNGDMSTTFGTATWVSGAHVVELKGEKGNGVGAGGGLEGLPPPQPSSQGSIGSQGSGSSGISDFESQPNQGVNKYNEARSPASVQSLPEQKPVAAPGTTNEKPFELARAVSENSPTKVTDADKEAKGMMRNVMVEMPCVSTKGVGPNGRRVEGFLYRYRKGEEVRIVCVCHGSFLTPAEFVKHAGGGDVAHPLRHIVVNRSPFL